MMHSNSQPFFNLEIMGSARKVKVVAGRLKMWKSQRTWDGQCPELDPPS